MDMVFLLDQWQDDLREELSLSLLPWSDHTQVTLRFSYAAPFIRKAGSPLAFDGPGVVPKGTGAVLENLLHGPGEAMTVAWNREVTKTLDRVMIIWHLLAHHSQNSLWFVEKLVEQKWIKRCLEHHWRKTKDESN